MSAETRLVPTDIPDPNTGESLYIEMRKPSRLLYWWRTSVLYFGIVFRDFHGARIGPILAWEICRGIWDYRKDMRVWDAHLPVPAGLQSNNEV